MSFLRLGDLAAYLEGELFGDPEFVVHGVREPSEAEEHDLIFLFDIRFLDEVLASRARAVVAGKGAQKRLGEKFVLEVTNPRLAFARVLARLFPLFRLPSGVHPLAFVHPQAELGHDVAVGPFAVIEEHASIGDRTCIFPHVYVGKGVRIGEDCVLYPQVVVREYCVIGNRVILHSGVVVGADGFGYEWNGEKYEKIPQVGGVIIEDDVEVGANATIDRATLGYTRIGRGTKIDNLVMIAHNVHVGEHSIIVAQSGIAGSSRIGDGVIIGGQAGIIDHCQVGRGARIAARAGVTAEVPPGATVSGFPAQEHYRELRERALVRKLPEMWQKLKDLEERVRRFLGE
ncbi:UDP-3-O-(3-hydroxymyristoyl)glucosamine N-acyltransferase [Candidatus Caldatribacterium sp.]|uniref:UDP-3-O-(3-hydroxymyristoyl)glucosamine N-acyltransferase n=1 Tax=Candidatus Caldatribacterium sp. TaxID=2282143 RepID=UPI0029915A8A|nr:UDP-3-O-(3-hydroxymyristoyl)glucosamine N-acyltransferase [Candidatus Caldatribacterium sp.]MDW8080397.1 UDP-3-O-(3-hydroxymyristoyl)glucosamine N-acyltransferase [Candidatus Calescibacterium sp.]